MSAPSPYSKEEMVGDYAREVSRYKTAAMSPDIAGDTPSQLGVTGATGAPSGVADAQVQPDEWRADFRVEVTGKRLTPSERLVLAMESFSNELSGRIVGYYSNLQNRAFDERSTIRYVAGALGRPLAKGATDAVRGAAGLLGLATNPRTQIATLQATGDAVTNPSATVRRASSAVESFLAKPVAEQAEAALQFLAGSAVAAVPVKVVGAIDELAALRSAGRSSDHFDAAGPEANGAKGSDALGNAEIAGTSKTRNPSTYTGDVYSPDFVGPVQWKYFYRGDATARTDFLSSMAQDRGVEATTDFLNNRATEPLSEIYAQHGVGSQGLPTIGVSDNPAVAEYFARGPYQNQDGFVTTFRLSPQDAEKFAIPNFENDYSFFENNPDIGLPEREYLFHVQIDPKYAIKQVQVGPK
jgi:hypothetical protein